LYFRGDTKLTETDLILLGDFANATGDPVFDGSLRDALSISLAQSPLLSLISAEKVTEALRSQSLPTSTPITREFAPKICARLGSSAFLTGSIARNGGGYDLKLSLFRCSDAAELASTKAKASGKDGVVHALGSAASKLRGEVGEDSTSLKKFDLPLDRATTSSLEALKSFAEGRRLTREQGSMEAVAALKRAVELDPRFALAYSNLAVGYYNLNQNALAADRIRQAFELADRQTVRDHLHITTLYYDLGTGDVQKAIASYKEWVKLYPRDDIAKGNLSSEYFLIGDYEQAVDLAQQALRLDPGSAAWYENVSTAYIALLRLDEAQGILNLAFSRKLDDPAMHADLYALAFLRGDSAGMQREMTWSRLMRAVCRRPGNFPAGPWKWHKLRNSPSQPPSGKESPHYAKQPTGTCRRHDRKRKKFSRLLRTVVTLKPLSALFSPAPATCGARNLCWTTWLPRTSPIPWCNPPGYPPFVRRQASSTRNLRRRWIFWKLSSPLNAGNSSAT
jgi:tetratricopeptide (TPR) repeat protein